MKTSQPLVMLPGQAQVLNILGAEYVIKVPGSATGGAFSLVESTVPVGSGAPPHIHGREDELFYVLEGSLEFQCSGRTIMAPKGTTVLLPKDIPHSFRNAGDVPARVLVTLAPAGFERFFEEINNLPPNLEELAKIGQKYGLQFVAST